jgi:NAD(P)-dependent dehydrogenase (short-subunit alcohol dehydrogenase family)
MSIYSFFKGNGPSGFGYGSTAEEVTAGLSLEGRTILVTGCNSGLGLETMRVLALRGAHVIGTARTEAKAREAGASITGRVTGLACELSDPASVRACVEAVKALGVRLDAVVCNAGIMALPPLAKAHGYELQFFTNHIGHFILVTGLLDTLTDEGRVVMLSSNAHVDAPKETIEFDNLSGDRSAGQWRAYGQSKMANLLFAKELSRRLEGTRRTANAVHPGVISTNLGRAMGPLMGPLVRMGLAIAGPLALKTIGEGAATEVYVAVHPAAATINGAYFANCNVATARPDSDDAAIARRLWDESERIVAALA